MTRTRRQAAVLVLVVVTGVLAACGREGPLPGARAERGQQLIQRYGCGTCHTIGGIEKANGKIGPPLTNFKDNRFIAGRLPNTPENVVRWILNPQEIEPRTIMPNLGVTPEEARAIADYLYTQ